MINHHAYFKIKYRSWSDAWVQGQSFLSHRQSDRVMSATRPGDMDADLVLPALWEEIR